jgi:four helix bundle protein
MGSGFKNLTVWQRSKALAVAIYRTTEAGAWARDYGLRDQIRRAAVSVPSNIAEGAERETDKESVRFLYIAKGSAGELQTQLMIAGEIGHMTQTEADTLCRECEEIARMLSALIKSRSATIR